MNDLHDYESDFNEDDYNSSDFDDETADKYYEEAEYPKPISRQKFTVLNESDIRHLQQAGIQEVSSVLSISRVESSILLHRHDWNVTKVLEAWFADEDRVRNSVGLLREPLVRPVPNSETLACAIYFEDCPFSQTKSAACGHLFCTDCWKMYVSTAIAESAACLTLKCPEPSCSAVIDEDMINRLANEKNKRKYDMYMLHSYVESNKSMRWCPGPDCEFAINLDDSVEANSDVTCICYHSFCLNCEEDAHRPVDCETVAKWMEKGQSESENTKWILAYTKPCPKCRKPIEKNKGCMHMTCRAPCNFQFCWLCLRAWSRCDSTCNRFVQGEEKTEEAKKTEIARNYLEKYTHYYERWAGNQFSRVKAIDNLNQMKDKQIKRLSESQKRPETEFQFIIEAWLQIVECRRVLKWTYAYGYYLPDDNEAKKQFFEYSQGEAEAALERLHHCAEMELRKFFNVNNGVEHDFNEFRRKLKGLTSVTKTYFENLVRALENGLLDVSGGGISGDSEK